jgi:Ni,Fe-hydrogenase I large subunit
MTRLAIDPVTRVGGHLRIEVDVSNGVVQDAWSAGTMFRGIENVLRGRDPRDAWLFAQRVCGACTGVHALASVRAVEAALDLTVPTNARLVRNLMAGAKFVQDHVVRFYHQHALDWVDLASAVRADPAATSRLARSVGDSPRSSAAYFRVTRDRLGALIESPQPGPFANGYWGHPAFRLSPEQNLMIAAHYLEALDWQRTMTKIHTLLGGKNPHPQTYLVGGMAMSPPWGGPHRALPGEHPTQVDRRAPNALSEDGLEDLADYLAEARQFVEQVYLPDIYALAGQYPEWLEIGRGIGNYLAFGEFPDDDSPDPALFLPRGRVMGDLAALGPVDQASIAESVAHAHYASDDGELPRHPSHGRTDPRYAGPPIPYTTLEGFDRYSWLKAPRYAGDPMEVGPLARLLMAYAVGRDDVRTAVDDAVARLGTTPLGLTGTLGRIVARAVETRLLVERLDGWLGELIANLQRGDLALADITKWDPGVWPREAEGWSLGEGPRGAVGHWVRIRDRRIEQYQIVDASTWNGSPRDDAGRRGPWEEALVGTPVADPARPLEILRTVHSFDPCPACAVHAWQPAGGGALDIICSGEGRP